MPGKSHGQRSPVGCSWWGCQGSDMTEHTCCVPLYTWTTHLHPFIGHWICRLFPSLGFVNSAAMNIWAHVSFWVIVLSGYRVGLLGHVTTPIFSILRKLHTVFQSDCTNLYSHLCSPDGSASKESAFNSGDCLPCRRPEFDSWVRKICWRRKWLLTPVFLPWQFHGQRNLRGYSPWGNKRWTWLGN